MIAQIQQLPAFLVDLIRICVWLFLLLLIFTPIERLFPLHPQKVFRQGFLVDLGYYFLNNILLKVLLLLPAAAIAWTMHRLVPGAVREWSASLPLVPRLLAALVVGEFGYYWGHRWAHEIPLLWRFHAIHHSAEKMDWIVSSRAHPVDLVFVRICVFVPLYAVGLAQPAARGTLDSATLFVLLVGSTWGYFIHANLRWRFGWLSVLIATPAFHHWHHTNDEHVDKNYASMLPIMDILFGSWFMPKKQWPPRYGISAPMASDLVGELAQPFLPGGSAKTTQQGAD